MTAPQPLAIPIEAGTPSPMNHDDLPIDWKDKDSKGSYDVAIAALKERNSRRNYVGRNEGDEFLSDAARLDGKGDL
jgi:hypothetical protein